MTKKMCKVFFLKTYIKIIKWLRSRGYIMQPVRSYLYKGKHYPFYIAPTYSTSTGRLYIKDHELFQSVKFIKQIDKLKKVTDFVNKWRITETPIV